MTKALQSLDEIGSVTYEAVADAESLDECIKTRKKKRILSDWSLELNIYGPKVMRDRVGQILSKARICLQQPRYLANSISVDNPHIISFSIQDSEDDQLQQIIPVSRSDPTPLPNMTKVLGDLDQAENLKPVDIDIRIVTKLLACISCNILLSF